MSEPSDGFFYKDRSRSSSEAASRQPAGREINVVKAAIQAYISRWLIPDTHQNKLLIDHAPRLSQFVQNREGARGIHFDIDQSWAEVDEVNTRKVQVARFVESLDRRLPAILIIDGGYRSRTAGLGDIQGGRMIGGIAFGFDLVVDLLVNIEIMIIAEDDSTCNDLSVLLTSTLGAPLRRFGGGNHIYSNDPNNHWQITLPLENEISALSRDTVGDDTTNQVWTASSSLEVMYDGQSTMMSGVPVRRGTGGIGTDGGHQIDFTTDGLPGNQVAISGPDNIGIRNPTKYKLTLITIGSEIVLNPKWRITISDFRIAVLDLHTMVLRPKALGTIEIRLHNENNDVIARKTVEVTP